jgi:hypothetical protein
MSPPSISTLVPLIALARSDARNTTVPATSSTAVARPIVRSLRNSIRRRRENDDRGVALIVAMSLASGRSLATPIMLPILPLPGWRIAVPIARENPPVPPKRPVGLPASSVSGASLVATNSRDSPRRPAPRRSPRRCRATCPRRGRSFPATPRPFAVSRTRVTARGRLQSFAAIASTSILYSGRASRLIINSVEAGTTPAKASFWISRHAGMSSGSSK